MGDNLNTPKIENLSIGRGVSISTMNDTIAINIKGMKKLALVDYSEEMLEIIIKARFRVPRTEETREGYKYPYSNECGKTLHQIAFDHMFSEEFRKELYDKNFIIEHLDNDGFNCVGSNLFFLLKVKNTYKGWHFDKITRDFVKTVSMRIYHIQENQTFQIVLCFNEVFINNITRESLAVIKLLYPYNYEIVLQDAEQIIESIIKTRQVKTSEWKDLYRFKDIIFEHFPQIEYTEEEKKIPYGGIIWRDGVPMIKVGSDEQSFGLMISTPYDKNWDIK